MHQTEWTLIGLLALVLTASLAEFGWSQFGHRTPMQAGVDRAPSQEASIAVLSFENMSDDPKNEFFSEGISEELLNDLTQVRGLQVAGRTSSFSFKGKKIGIPEIGKALRVRAVLEGKSAAKATACASRRSSSTWRTTTISGRKHTTAKSPISSPFRTRLAAPSQRN